jgi:hypothetical protein
MLGVRKKMPNSIDLSRFPFIKQNGDFCIPCSIENVLRYHGENVDQYQIVFLWLQNHAMNAIDIPGIANTLRRSKFRYNFEFIVGGRLGTPNNHIVDFTNEQGLIDYAKQCCDHGNPLIVVIGPRNSPGAHMIVVIGYINGNIMFFDPANNSKFPSCICFVSENSLINNPPFKQNLTTLLIKLK